MMNRRWNRRWQWNHARKNHAGEHYSLSIYTRMISCLSYPAWLLRDAQCPSALTSTSPASATIWPKLGGSSTGIDRIFTRQCHDWRRWRVKFQSTPTGFSFASIVDAVSSRKPTPVQSKSRCGSTEGSSKGCRRWPRRVHLPTGL